MIQGDGIDYFMLDKILELVKSNGWSIDNIAFGSGEGYCKSSTEIPKSLLLSVLLF